jgi:hypothetical protein
MRRVNIEAAFLGEGGVSDTGDEEGLALSVRGGEVVLVLPAGTPENRAVESASILRGSLRLETGRVLTFEIHDGAVGAFFLPAYRAMPPQLVSKEALSSANALTELSGRAASQ